MIDIMKVKWGKKMNLNDFIKVLKVVIGCCRLLKIVEA